MQLGRLVARRMRQAHANALASKREGQSISDTTYRRSSKIDLFLFVLPHRPIVSACRRHAFPSIDHNPSTLFRALLCGIQCIGTKPANGLFPFLLTVFL